MEGGMEEPNGPCHCQGTVCNKGFGWIMGKIQDLAGNFHSGRHNVEICDMFPEELMEWDAEDGMFLPPLPPGISNLDTMKGFMGHFKGTGKDLQTANKTEQVSERALERITRKGLQTDAEFREKYS